jgi:hypothetical protein
MRTLRPPAGPAAELTGLPAIDIPVSAMFHSGYNPSHRVPAKEM